jgi:hypothetical protein
MTEPLPPEWDSWCEEVGRLQAVPPLRRNEIATRGPEDKKFLIGDVLLKVPTRLIDPLAEAVGEDPGTLRGYREVAKRFPPAARVAASWSVHRDLKDKPELVRPGLTVREAAVLAGKKPIDSKAAHRRTVGQRADDVRALLADPDVRAVIEAERHLSQEERRARSAARNWTSEMDAQAKALEAELREARNAKSPYEATVKATLDLHKAAQLADAVGMSMNDLEEPERLALALRTLIASATGALEKYEDEVNVVDGEAWEARPEAYGLADSAQRDLPPTGRVVNHNG